MEENQKPQLKLVELGRYKFPSYFTSDMKTYGKKLIEELVNAKMLAVPDLELVFNYITDVFMLRKVNAQILECENSAELKRLMTIKNGTVNNMLKESNALGLNVKARSTGLKEVTERYDYNYKEDIEFYTEED